MAIISKLILSSEEGLEREYPEAYFRIHKITSANVDYEFLENIEDPNRPDVQQELKWITRYESSALVYVWSDKEARKNRAQVLHWFNIDFEFNDKEVDNIYKQAYRALKKVFPVNGDC